MHAKFEAVKGKIVDFRLRPPTGPYRVFFTETIVDRLTRMLGDPGMPGSYKKSLEGMPDSDDQALAVLYKEMESAGVRVGVMNGRHSPNRPIPVHISDTYLQELAEKAEGRLIGLAGIDLDQPVETIVTGIEKAVKELGLRGVCIEPGLARNPMYAEDEHLMPIYQKVAELGVPLMFMSGPLAGPDISHTDPIHFERVARVFPEMPIVLGHGAYPYISEAIALALKSEATGRTNVYVSPDVYMLMPGAQAYIEAINLMPQRMLFGSSYSFCSVETAVKRTMQMDVGEDALHMYMYKNAERLLGL